MKTVRNLTASLLIVLNNFIPCSGVFTTGWKSTIKINSVDEYPKYANSFQGIISFLYLLVFYAFRGYRNETLT